MTYTYGDVKIGDLIDSDLIIATERIWAGPMGARAQEYVRLTAKSGGIRTELASHPAGPTNRKLADVNDQDLTKGADALADYYRERVVPEAWSLEALHGVAVEMNRRRAA